MPPELLPDSSAGERARSWHGAAHDDSACPRQAAEGDKLGRELVGQVPGR